MGKSARCERLYATDAPNATICRHIKIVYAYHEVCYQEVKIVGVPKFADCTLSWGSQSGLLYTFRVSPKCSH